MIFASKASTLLDLALAKANHCTKIFLCVCFAPRSIRSELGGQAAAWGEGWDQAASG